MSPQRFLSLGFPLNASLWRGAAGRNAGRKQACYSAHEVPREEEKETAPCWTCPLPSPLLPSRPPSSVYCRLGPEPRTRKHRATRPARACARLRCPLDPRSQGETQEGERRCAHDPSFLSAGNSSAVGNEAVSTPSESRGTSTTQRPRLTQKHTKSEHVTQLPLNQTKQGSSLILGPQAR